MLPLRRLPTSIHLLILFLSLGIAPGTVLFAQPSGEPIVATAIYGSYKFEGTGRDFTFSEQKTSQATGKSYYSKVLTWRAPAGREIKGFDLKKGNIDVVFILLDDGSVYETTYNSFLGWSVPNPRTKTDVSGNYSGFTKLVGDALYSFSHSAVFVSRDTAATWSLDTTGIGTGLYNDIATDTLQNVYLAHGNGLFKQHPDSSVWHKLSSFPETYANAVFVDARNRIYAGTYFSAYLSTDGGNSWTSKSAGLLSGGLTSFGEDAFHNIYAIGGGAVYRSDSGTSAWTRIDTAISNNIKDPISQFASPYNSVGGDTILYLGTNYGLFSSTNQGRTWSEDNDGIQATTLFGYLKTSSRQFESTGLGLYYLNNGDTTWSKTFPSVGYEVGNSIYSANSGNLYTLGTVFSVNNSQGPNTNWKSTDNGSTWFPDTSGIGAMVGGSIPKYLADESGVQHYAVSNIPAKCFMKSSGSPWTVDTAGWGILPGNYPNIIASDMHGNIYAAVTTTSDFTGLLLRRPIAGGTWALDTSGLQRAIVYSISVNQSGNVYAGTFGNGIYKKTGSTWAPLSSPGGLNGNDAFVTAVDKSGALFAGFAYQNGFNYAWQGVYYSTNDGGSWTKVGLDGIAVRQLIAYGDSIYAVTYYDGLYILTKSGATGIQRSSGLAPASFALLQNYPNPFNPMTRISFQLAADSKVSLKIYDLLGREVETLVNRPMEAGTHQVSFDASKFASGIYFYRIQAGGFTETKKLVLLK